MTPTQALLAGALQGITEFLPISSSGHLVLFNQVFGITNTDISFETIVHFATFIAIGGYFKNEIRNLTKVQLKHIVITSLPILMVGFLIKDYVDQIFSNPIIAGCGLIVTGLVLYSADHSLLKSPNSKLSNKSAFITGLFQAAAILPGISRSGLTVSGSLISGVKRDVAFTHAFLTGFVVISIATGYQLISTPIQNVLTAVNLIGFLTALTVGLASLKIFEYILIRTKLSYFAAYCITLGTIVIIAQTVY